jgi:DNA-binding response OmpR family regulator
MPSGPSRPLVMLAEDEAIIAIELEDSLTAAGFAVAGPFTTCKQAEAWLRSGKPDAAIVDHKLKDGLCDALVRDLSRRGVPTIVFTGHEAPPPAAADMRAATWVTKPIAFPALLNQLRREMQAQA